MKYLLILADGAADEPLEELGGKTPLEVAKKPNMDMIAKKGRCGMLKTVDESMTPGSDVANMSILGYDPEKYYTGRGALEALSMGIPFGDDGIEKGRQGTVSHRIDPGKNGTGKQCNIQNAQKCQCNIFDNTDHV